jgi:hypothetical protein
MLMCVICQPAATAAGLSNCLGNSQREAVFSQQLLKLICGLLSLSGTFFHEGPFFG